MELKPKPDNASIQAGTESPAVSDEMAAAIPDRYEIEGLIAAGGMGSVYAAHHKITNQRVAIKVLRAHEKQSLVDIKRFQREAKAIAQLNHPNIVRLIDFGVGENGSTYMVMELAQGETLREILRRENPLEIERICNLISQTCDGLAAAHRQGIIHRDIKPSNIIVSKTPDGEAVQIIDFGIARVITENKENTLTATGEIVGTPQYMSPEQALGHKCDARSDIYSLGCVLYQMLTGTAPFDGANAIETIFNHVNQLPQPLHVRRPDARFPDAIQQVVYRCLSKDRDTRYQQTEHLKEDLAVAIFGNGNLRPFKQLSSASIETRKAQFSLKSFILGALVLWFLGPTLINLAFLGGSFFSPPTATIVGNSKAAEAERAYNAHDTAKAIALYKAAIDEGERSGIDSRHAADFYQRLSRIYADKGMKGQQAHASERAASLLVLDVAQSTDNYCLAGDCYMAIRDYNNAVRCYLDAWETRNQHPEVQNYRTGNDVIVLDLVKGYIGAKDYSQAEKYARAADGLASARDTVAAADTYCSLAHLLNSNGRTQEALKWSRKAADIYTLNGDESGLKDVYQFQSLIEAGHKN